MKRLLSAGESLALGMKAVRAGKTETFRIHTADITSQEYKKEIKMYAWLLEILSR